MDPVTRAQALVLQLHELSYATLGSTVRSAGDAAVASIRAACGLDAKAQPQASPVGSTATSTGEESAGIDEATGRPQPGDVQASFGAAPEPMRQTPERVQSGVVLAVNGTAAATEALPQHTEPAVAAELLLEKLRELEHVLEELAARFSLGGLGDAFAERQLPVPLVLQEASVLEWSLLEPVAAQLREMYKVLAAELSTAAEELCMDLESTAHGRALLEVSPGRGDSERTPEYTT
jgi:hypothetical protein